MNTRFTIDGSVALESHLADTCRKVCSGVQKIVSKSALEAIVLGGGYGRGHGGVLATKTADLPYNDMEFYVFIRGNVTLARRRYRAPLERLGEELSPEAGLHVEFKIESIKRFQRSELTMYSYDLVAGHKILFGDANLFHGCEHHLAADRIPCGEATRLLFNRCSGLLLARNLLHQYSLQPDDLDFVGRNLAKAQLGFGDAVLTIFGHYHWDCRERHERLGKLQPFDAPRWLADVRRHHAEGVAFKLHPQRTISRKGDLALRFSELHALGRCVWLWAESRRLNRPFVSPRSYALDPAPKCPETSAWRNALGGLKTFGTRALRGGKLLRYPRERLFNSLCLLLWDDNAGNDTALMRRVQNHLCARSTGWQDLMLAYRGLWQNYG